MNLRNRLRFWHMRLFGYTWHCDRCVPPSKFRVVSPTQEALSDSKKRHLMDDHGVISW